MNKWLLAVLALLTTQSLRADDWPQWMGPTRDGVWRETGIVKRLPEKLDVKWRVPVKHGYAGPAVAGSNVFVTDFDAEGDFTPDPGKKSKLAGKERVFCLDAKSGQEKWHYEYDCDYDVSFPGGPRATPAYHENNLYVLGAMGHLTCISVRTGEMGWNVDLKEKFGAKTPHWGFTSHPLVDDKLYLVVGGKGSGVVAFNKKNGNVVWKALDLEEQGYGPPTLIEAGGKRQLLIVTPKAIYGLNPDNGETYWSVPYEPAFGMSICAPQRDGDILYTAGEGDKAVAVKLLDDKPAVKELWRGQAGTAVYPVCGTPIPYQGYLYGVCTRGELRCVDLKNGKRMWSDKQPIAGGRSKDSGSAFIVRNGDRFFIFSETGELILAKMTPQKYTELGRAKLVEPTDSAWGRDVVWSHPAFAQKCVFARNDKEIVCASLAE